MTTAEHKGIDGPLWVDDPVAFLEMITDSVPAFISYVDRDLRYRFTNAAYAQLFRRRRDEMLGRRVEDVIGSEALSLVRPYIERSLAGETVTYSRPMEYKNGEVVDIEAVITPHRDTQGDVRGLVALVVDVTRQKKLAEELERALSNTEASFHSLIEATPDAVIVHRDRRVVYVNAALLDLLGYDSAAELAGASVETIIPERIRESVRKRHAQLQETGVVPVHEGGLLRRDGVEVPVEVQALKVEFGGGTAVLTTARDISQRQQLTAKMMQMDRVISVGTLAAGVGHEINNPLTFIESNLTFAARTIEDIQSRLARDEPVAEDLGVALGELGAAMAEAREGTERVADVVRALRRLSRDDDHEVALVDLGPVIESAVKMASNEARHRAQLQIELERLPPVMGNASRLGQVVLNLVVNAAQAIELGRAAENTIIVRALERGKKVVLEVQDTGCGIPAEDIRRIYDPFFTTKPPGQGTGLGLSICREIVEAHDAEILVESEVGRGTTFRVVLPAAPEAREDTSSRAPLVDLERRLRVLIVDDEPSVCTGFERLLRRTHDVESAGDGEQALAKITSGKTYDVILCDLMMPNMTGMELHEKLAALSADTARRIVFLSGGTFAPKARQFVASVANPCLTKPVRAKYLRQILAEHAAKCSAQ